MKYCLKSKDGNFKFAVEMGCNHPDMKNNSTESVGCSGNCDKCRFSIATLTIPAFMELIERAECNNRI